MLKRIKARLKNRSGFSLAELLITLLILLLATAIVTTGVPAAAGALRKVVDASNAQLLLSTTMTRLRDELSTAKIDKEKTSGTTITYTNSAGALCELAPGVDEDGASGILCKAQSGTGESAEKIEYLLVSEKAAGGLEVSYTDVDYVDGVVTIKGLTVTKGETTLASVTNDAGQPGVYQIRVLDSGS